MSFFLIVGISCQLGTRKADLGLHVWKRCFAGTNHLYEFFSRGFLLWLRWLFLQVDCNSSPIVVTEPYFNFSSIQENMNELLFEEYDFKSIFRCNGQKIPKQNNQNWILNRCLDLFTAGFLTQHKYSKDRGSEPICCLVVDSGYSFTHIVPYVNGETIKEGLHRFVTAWYSWI